MRLEQSLWESLRHTLATSYVSPEDEDDSEDINILDRNVSSYVTDVSGTSAGSFHLFSDVDVRTARLRC